MIIYKALLVSFFCVGFYNAMQEGQILSFYKVWISYLPELVFKPLGGCLTCMASVYTLIVSLLLSWPLSSEILVIICVASSFNFFLSKYFYE